MLMTRELPRERDIANWRAVRVSILKDSSDDRPSQRSVVSQDMTGSPLERLRYLTHDEGGLDLFALSRWFDEVSAAIFRVGCQYLGGALRHRGLVEVVEEGERGRRWLFEPSWRVGEVTGRLSLTLVRRFGSAHMSWEPLLCVGARLTPVGPGCTRRGGAQRVVEALSVLGERAAPSDLEASLAELEAAIDDADFGAAALRRWLSGMPDALEPFAGQLLSAQLTRRISPRAACRSLAGGHRWEFPLSPPLERAVGVTALLVVPRRVSPVVCWEAYAETEKASCEVATGCDTREEAEAALRAFELSPSWV